MTHVHPSGEKHCWEATLATSSGIEDVATLIGCRHPVNWIGSEAALETLGWGRAIRVHGCEIHGIHPAALVAETLDRGGGRDALVRGVAARLVPRSSTVVLDPWLARMLVENPETLERLSLNTAGCVLMPLEVASASYRVVYSDVFSFPEQDPVGTSHWVWTERQGRAFCTIAHEGGAGEYDVAFTLTAANPGSFAVRLGESVLRHTATAGSLARRFELFCHLTSGANTIEIDFDGPSSRPESTQDQRKEIYFCLGDLKVTSTRITSRTAADSQTLACLSDEALRRLAHAAGFFEVATVACSQHDLAWQVGLRSCFDYRQDFRFRDYRRFHGPHDRPARAPADVPRCLWYRFAKTPHAGAEWSGYVPPTSLESAILAERPTSRMPEDALTVYERQLAEVRVLLAERTDLLEKSNRALEDHSRELLDVRAVLEERTQLLQASNRVVEEHSAELTTLRKLLAERTGLLEKSNEALEERSRELLDVRAVLEERTRSLKESIATLTEQLADTRNLLVERTTALEQAVQDRDATALCLAESRNTSDVQSRRADAVRHSIGEVNVYLAEMLAGPLAGPPLFLVRHNLRTISESLAKIRDRLDTITHSVRRPEPYPP
jgi:hypothetical protein